MVSVFGYDLKERFVSAVFLVAIAAALIYLGKPWVFFLIAGFCGLGFYEWAVMTRHTKNHALKIIGFALLTLGTFASFNIALRLWQEVVLVIVIACATDIGAYFSGRFFQGPKLMPSVSPSKTWSGSVGGVVASVIVSLPFMFFASLPMNKAFFLPLVILLSISCQGGDLLESYAKRLLKVKDSGHLIPGHGGVLDRLDGLLAVAFIYALITS